MVLEVGSWAFKKVSMDILRSKFICCQLCVAHWLQPEAKCGEFLCVRALGGDSTGKMHGTSLINDLKQASHKAKVCFQFKSNVMQILHVVLLLL